VLLKGEPYTVIGILPDNATTPLNADLYIALQATREGEGRGTNFRAVLRLRDGATWQQANAEIDRAFSQSQGVQRRIRNGAQVTYYSVPLQKAQTEMLGPQSLGLMIAAGFILLIACANLAGLTLVRLLRRTGEITTRLALGASPWQIQKQLWNECLPLALAGGGAGIAVGFAALRGLLMLLPEHFLPVAVHLDGRVLGFTLGLALCTSILFGMLPALSARRIDLRSSIASRTVMATGSVGLRQLLIAGEVALTVVLLAAAGLLVRTLIHLETLPPGFNPRGVITAKASLDDVRYQDPAAFRKLLNESLASMRAIPGVENAAVGYALPYERSVIGGVTVAQGGYAGRQIATYEVYVTPGYFDTLEIPVVEGRAFTDGDGADTLPVVIVGIFALVANLVVQKRREIGIRIALGSTIQRAMVHIGKPGLLATALGLFLGLAIAAAALRTMRSLLFGLDVYDAPTIVLVVVTVSVVTILAITLPALRVATIDPAKTLREE